MSNPLESVLHAVEGIAPVAAGVVGGPAAAGIVDSIEKALGVGPEAAAAVATAVATQTALQIQDTASARSMETATKDWTPKVLAIGVSAGFFGLLAFMACHEVPPTSKDLLNIMTGALGTAWATIIAFYFGSSAGSEAKNVLLARSGK